MAKRGTPLIAPALAQQAVRCIKKAAAGVEALATSELALGMTVYTISNETSLSRADVAKVLEQITKLPENCLVSEEKEEEKTPKRKKRRRRAKKRR